MKTRHPLTILRWICRSLIVAAWIALPLLMRDAARGAEAPQTAPLAVGMNLSSVNDWNREWVFVDVFKQSRSWISQNSGGVGPWDNGRTVAQDGRGWPRLAGGQATATLMCRDLDGHYPAGVYQCSYEGRGEIAFGFDGRARVNQPGRVLVDVVPSNAGILLRIDHSEPSDPIRNIRLTMPGFDGKTTTFHPLFLERLRPFKTLRFMDWGATNNSTLRSWDDRTMTLDARQSGPAGVAPEYMIELCNALHADPWFCMPHQADDDFVRHFAELVRDQLHREATIYVEWSNETWNSLFQQAGWVQDEAKRRGCIWTKVIADEAQRDWQVWREVFGPQQQRVVRVLAGQHYNPWVCQDIAEHLRGEFDAIACGAYFFPQPADEARFGAATSPSEVLASCAANIEGPGIENWQKHRQLATQWSKRQGREIRLLAYEGGQHLTTSGRNLPYTDVYARTQSDPQIEQIYRRLFAALRQNGFDAMAAFNYVGHQDVYGSWGHLRFQDEALADAPKFRALLEAAGTSPLGTTTSKVSN